MARDRALAPDGVEPRPQGFVLGREASFRVCAAVVAHTLWTSAAPAISYRVYAETWYLSPTTTAAIFAVYPIAVVCTLVAFGTLADQVDTRVAMLAGLSASLLGVLLFALALSPPWLFAGRILMGLGVGLSAAPSTAALIELGPRDGGRRAAAATAFAQASGFAAALLVGGALTAYAPWPTHLSFWVLFVLLGGLIVLVHRLPRQARPVGAAWRPTLPTIPRARRSAFLPAAIGASTAYMHGAVVLSFGGQIAHDLVGSGNALVNGATLALFGIASAGTSMATRRWHVRTALAVGALVSAAAMTLLACAVAWQALSFLLAAILTSGIGYALLFFGSLELIGGGLPAAHRGSVLSTLYLCAYLAMGALSLGLGAVATRHGLGFAADLGAAVIALASLLTLGLAWGTRRHRTSP